jgi:hypothetical protein
MKTIRIFAAVMGIACMLGLAACASPSRPAPPEYAGAIRSGAIPPGQGAVQAIAPVPGEQGVLRFTIRMDNGEVHTLRHQGRAGFRVGDRVRIRGGMMERI